MSGPSSYDIKRPSSPVPLSRRATVVREAASRYWDMFTRYRGDDQSKWFDCDIALAESADALDRLATLSALTSDEYVIDLLNRAIEKHTPAEASDEAAA
ncbi:hypothetical protein [Methylobacterium brachythecii]|uniref:Uncharacterized protein n=1 Tax=Methylobacterium brachythecii TaxID=1176177 RepID=A0A7W6APY3_9HYPH|nr:hypothetical protein [Methylobacterium brachythecii]MBB3905100.1 hypothetical protein [Methylobacterium brachythecii]GLS44392.1 hypothetical protein GCM10007884_23800 [Methylobacterium brachythecii]